MLAGVGKALRLYELGKKALLRKCENNVSVQAIVAICGCNARFNESTFLLCP